MSVWNNSSSYSYCSLKWLSRDFPNATRSEGYRLNVANHDGSTPLHMAVYRDDPEIVGMLLDCKGLNINARNNVGNTPLHLAIEFGHHASTNRLVVTSGIDLDVVNNDGLTPFVIAMTAPKSPETIQFLLIHRAIIAENMQHSLLKEDLKPSNKSLFMHVLLAGLDIGVYPERKRELSTRSEPEILQVRAHNFLTREDFQGQVTYGKFFNVGKHCFEYQKLSRVKHPVPLKEKGSIKDIENMNVFCQLQEKRKLPPELILPVIEKVQNEQIEMLANYCNIRRFLSERLYYALSEPNLVPKSSYLYPEPFSEDCFRLLDTSRI